MNELAQGKKLPVVLNGLARTRSSLAMGLEPTIIQVADNVLLEDDRRQLTEGLSGCDGPVVGRIRSVNLLKDYDHQRGVRSL